MELSLQLAYKISKKKNGACILLIRVWWFKIPFTRFQKLSSYRSKEHFASLSKINILFSEQAARTLIS